MGQIMQWVKNNLKTRNIIKSILLTFPMALLIIVLLSDGNFHIFYSEKSIPFIITYLFFISSFFLMIYTGKTDKYRALIFILFSIFLSFSFIYNMFEVRDTMAFNETNIYESNIPFCHLVIPMIIIPAALTQTIIFPGSIIGGFASISMMIALWFFSSLAIGRGFCSWGCFYGGWDDAFSRIKKKRILKYLPGILRYASFAILLLVVISAASTLSPTYCSWICPFKTVTEFEEINSTTSVIKTIIFLSLFIGLVIIIPILTKKRTQCALFCPLGALQS
jgi:ferredoxin-type protein NapH